MITYDTTADALYIYLTEEGPAAKAARVTPLDDARIIDYAEDGTVLGVELLGVSQGIDLDGIPERAKVEEQLEKLRCAIGAAA